MNELFTLLIILAAIISFLNKIFGQKRPQQTQTPAPVPGQKTREWIPPWLESEDLEVPEFEEEETSPGKIIFEPLSDKAASDVRKVSTAAPDFTKPAKALESYSSRISRLEIDLSSGDALKQGIVLAEILGTCKGRKNLKIAQSH